MMNEKSPHRGICSSSQCVCVNNPVWYILFIHENISRIFSNCQTIVRLTDDPLEFLSIPPMIFMSFVWFSFSTWWENKLQWIQNFQKISNAQALSSYVILRLEFQVFHMQSLGCSCLDLDFFLYRLKTNL